MTGPGANGSLRRSWRYELLGIIADEQGDFDADVWNALTSSVAAMVAEAKREAWEEGYDAGFDYAAFAVESLPYSNPYKARRD